MPASTPIYGLQYLVQGEPARNLRAALEANAKATEAALQARGVAAAGAADVLAVAARATALEARHRAMTAAARIALTPAQLTAGDTVWETDTNRVARWTGTQWRAASSEVLYSQGVNNTAWAPTAYTWTVGLGAKLAVPADYVRRRFLVAANCSIRGTESWWRIRLDLAANAGAGLAAATSYWPTTNGYKSNVPTGSEVQGALMGGGDIDGRQAASWYLEARVDTAGSGNFTYPFLTLTLTP